MSNRTYLITGASHGTLRTGHLAQLNPSAHISAWRKFPRKPLCVSPPKKRYFVRNLVVQSRGEVKKMPSGPGRLEALAEERRCFIGDTDDFVGCLPIEFEIELCPRPAVIPVGEMLEFAASH